MVSILPPPSYVTFPPDAKFSTPPYSGKKSILKNVSYVKIPGNKKQEGLKVLKGALPYLGVTNTLKKTIAYVPTISQSSLAKSGQKDGVLCSAVTPSALSWDDMNNQLPALAENIRTADKNINMSSINLCKLREKFIEQQSELRRLIMGGNNIDNLSALIDIQIGFKNSLPEYLKNNNSLSESVSELKAGLLEMETTSEYVTAPSPKVLQEMGIRLDALKKAMSECISKQNSSEHSQSVMESQLRTMAGKIKAVIESNNLSRMPRETLQELRNSLQADLDRRRSEGAEYLKSLNIMHGKFRQLVLVERNSITKPNVPESLTSVRGKLGTVRSDVDKFICQLDKLHEAFNALIPSLDKRSMVEHPPLNNATEELNKLRNVAKLLAFHAKSIPARMADVESELQKVIIAQ